MNANEFLQKRRAANGNTYGGTGETTGGKASEFLRAKAAEQRSVIDRTFGSDAYGGSTYTPASPKPTYRSVQNAMTPTAGASGALTGLRTAALQGAGTVERAAAAKRAALPSGLPSGSSMPFGLPSGSDMLALTRQRDDDKLETLRKRAEELETQYRQISQDASRARYRKYTSELNEAGELWRAARDEYEQALAEMGLEKPSFGERVLKMFSGAGKQYLGSTWDTVGVMASGGTAEAEIYQEQLESLYGERQRTEEWLKQPEDEQERRQLEARLTSLNEQISVYEALARESAGLSEGVRDAAAEITQSGAADLERAKFRATKAGQLLVDAGAAGAQMAGDAALGAMTGFGSMVPMMVRSFGGGTQQAREKGYSQKQQIAMGLSSAATEYFSEKLFGGNPVYDSDAGLVSKLVGKITSNETLLDYLASKPAEMLYEGLEEVVADLLDPLAEQIIAGQHDELTLEQIIEDGLVGIMVAGGAHGVVKLADTAAQGINTRRTGKFFSDMGEDAVRSVVQEGLDSDPSTQSHKLAQQLQQKLDQGENISAAELGQLYQSNVQAIDAEEGGGLLERAAGELAKEGRVTNSTARDILENPTARATLEAEVGLSASEDMTMSQQRAAVKSAVESLASRDNGADTAAATNNTARQTTEQTAAQARPVAQQAYDAARIRRAASALGDNGAKALAAAYDGSMNADGYYAGFSAYYEAGLSGRGMDGVKGLYAEKLNEAQRYAAYAAGQNDAAASLAAEREGVKSATVYGDEAGFIQTAESANLPRSTVQYYDNMAKAVGVKIQIAPATGEGGANGWYANGVLHIAKDAENPGMAVAKHEITHRMQELAPEEYRKYRDYAVNARTEQHGSSTLLVSEYKARYAGSGINLTTEQAMDEIAADFTEALAAEPQQFERLARQNRSVAQRLLDAVRDFIDRVKGMFKGSEAKQNQTAAEAFGTNIKSLEKAARLWDKALTASARQAAAMGANNNAARTDGAVRYSINEQFSQDIREWNEAGRPEGERFILGSTGQVLQGLGAIESDIYMNGDKISAILKQHPEMTIQEIRHIPELLEDPVLVLKSKNTAKSQYGNSRLVMFGSVKAQDGRPVMCVLDLRPTEHGFLLDDMQKVTSAYTKDINPVNFIQRSEILHADKKRTVPLLRDVGFTRPASLLQDGSIGSISYNGKSVNLTGEKFSEVVKLGETGDTAKQARFSLKSDSMGRALSKEQQEYFRDSKAVDEKGRLLVLYHGSKKGGFTTFRDWSYLTASERYARRYAGQDTGKTMYEIYANIRKPFDTRLAECREIWEQEYYGVYSRTPIQDSGLPDWTDGYDLVDFLEENGYDYDAILLDEGADNINGEVVERGVSYVVRSSEQIKRVDNKTPTANPDIRYSLKTDNRGRELSEEQQEYFKDSKATDSDGRLMVLYHQTENEFTVFDPRRQGAGARDDTTPFGIFLKSSDRDIGLKGKKQMALYANITNPLAATNRDDLVQKLRQLSPEYDRAVQQHEALDQEYHEKFEAAKKAWRDYVTKWREENPDAKRSELYDVPEFNRLFEAEDAVVDEWTEKADELSRQAKEALTRALRDAGYDGVFLLNDAGSWGRSTDAYIALDPEQVKNIDNKTPTASQDIRYSLKSDSMGRELTKEQQKYFGDSKITNGDGQLLVLYHGTTAYGDITKFRRGRSGWLGPGIYLASRQMDAQRYADAMGEGNGQVYELYANVTNPLVVTGSNPVPEILKAAYNKDSVYKARSAKQTNDTHIITPADIKKLQSRGYDGIRWDFGTSTEVSVFSPEQLKRVDNASPTNSPDIRRSLKGSSNIQREMAALQKENALLRERLDYWKGQTKRTERVTTDKKAVAKAARELIRSFGANIGAEDIQGDLQDLYDYISNGSDGKNELTGTEAWARAGAIAEKLVENAVAVDDDGYRQYSDLRDYLRTTNIVLGKEYHGDIADFGAFRRGLFGRVNLKTKGNTNIDQVYQELSSLWPEFFDEQRESNPTDQLLRIAEVLDGIYNVTEYNPFSNNMEEAVTYAANEIMEGFFDLPQTRATFADRQARKLDDAKAKGHQQAQRIREQDSARMDKLRAQNKERIRRVIERERVVRERQLTKLKERYTARDAAGRERQKCREMRAKITRHAKGLSQKLLRPSDKAHIPENLRQSVAAVLEAINLEGQYVIDPETGKRKKGADGAPTKRTEAFLKLKAQYAEIARSGEGLVIDPALFGDAAESIQGSFDAVIAMGETKLADMNSRQLETVWQVLKAVEHSVSSAGKVLSRAKYERTSEWANALRTDSKGRKSKRPLSKKHAALDLETPYTFFSHYGEAGKAVYRMLRDAQDRQQVLVNQIAEAAGEIADPKLVRQLEKNARSYTTQEGEVLTLSDAQLMELYLLDKRPQGREHLLGNGVYQPEVKSRHIRRGTKSIRLTPEDLSALADMLTSEQKKTADRLQAMTAGLLADMGNEASMTAYGYKKFTEEHYWPIRSAREEIHSSVEKGGDQPRSIKNTGFAQQLQPRSNNAVDIGSVFDTFSDHAAGMAEYAAWLCPMEDAGRLFNYKFMTADADGKMHSTGENVKNLLDRVGGPGAHQYWERLMEDIQNGIRAKSDSPMWDYVAKSISGFKGAAVGANIRVILQQPTAFFRAGAVLNPADMAVALTVGWANGRGWKKALKWSPIAMRKDNGSFDISSPQSMKDTLFDQRSGMRKVNDALSAPAGWADAVTWGVLWNACENQTARTHKEMARGSDEFYRETARAFAEVIDQTQVVDGVLQRSNIMRSSNAVVQQATSFMGEPIMSLNLMMRSWDNFRYEQDKVKRGKAMKAMGRAALALTVTAAANALAQSLVDGIRDDDKDKKYWERVMAAFTGLTGDEESAWDKAKGLSGGNFGSNLNVVGQIPFAKDVLSLAQGYSVSRTEAEVVEDLIAAGEMSVEAAQGGKYTPQYAAIETLAAAAKLFGTPASNIKRDVLGLCRSVLTETDNIPAQYELEKAIYNLGSPLNRGRYYDLLYKALELEDMDSYWHIREDLMESMGLDGKTLDSAMKSRYAKHLEKDSGYALPRQAQDLIGMRESYGDGDAEDGGGFTAKDLGPKEYQRYASERAESYRTVADELEGFSTFKTLDTITKDKALSAADSLTEKLALEASSGGAYTADTKWMLWATGGGDAGVSEAEAILFKVAYDMTEGDKDPDTGKTVSGSKKENVLEAAAEMMPWLTDRELEYLMGNYWK